MAFHKLNIEEFLISRGWTLSSEGNLFDNYLPPSELRLGNDFNLEVANDEYKVGFQKYSESLVGTLYDIYDGKISEEDFDTFFSSNSTILSLRIADEDTKDGSIQLERFAKAIDNLKLVFKQTVTFVMSSKPIFGESKNIAEHYVKRCRALQTDIGSYITKVQLPGSQIQTTIESLDTQLIPNKLYEVLDFTDQEILRPKIAITNIDKNYLSDYESYLNVELLTSIKDLCSQSSLNNFDFYFNNYKITKGVEFNAVKPQLSYFSNYIKQLKSLFLEESPLEFIGVIRKLSSNSPKQSNANEIIIEGEIANNKERVKVILNRDDYNKAIEAHQLELKVKVKGIAKEFQTQYNINQPELFEVLNVS